MRRRLSVAVTLMRLGYMALARQEVSAAERDLREYSAIVTRLSPGLYQPRQ